MTGPFIKILAEHLKFICENELYQWRNKLASNIIIINDEWYISDLDQIITVKVITSAAIPDCFRDRTMKLNGIREDGYVPLDYLDTRTLNNLLVDTYVDPDTGEAVFINRKLLKKYFTAGEQDELVFYGQTNGNMAKEMIQIGDADGNLLGYICPVKINN